MNSGYSATPLIKKLGYKPSNKVLLINSPLNYFDLLGVIPEGIEFDDTIRGKDYDLVHFFSIECVEVETKLRELKDVIHNKGMIWVSWPKKSSKVATDLSDKFIRETGLSTGLVDVKVCAVDEKWSALKFVYRLKDR